MIKSAVRSTCWLAASTANREQISGSIGEDGNCEKRNDTHFQSPKINCSLRGKWNIKRSYIFQCCGTHFSIFPYSASWSAKQKGQDEPFLWAWCNRNRSQKSGGGALRQTWCSLGLVLTMPQYSAREVKGSHPTRLYSTVVRRGLTP